MRSYFLMGPENIHARETEEIILEVNKKFLHYPSYIYDKTGHQKLLNILNPPIKINSM